MPLRKTLAFLFLVLGVPCWLLAALYDPIAVYLTWQRSPETTMTVQWISTNERTEDKVDYQRVGESSWKTVEGVHRAMPENYPFLIHHAEITNLLPDTEYRFKTGSDAIAYKFRTMPAKMTTPIRFIVGGDIYHDGLDILEKMNRQVAKLNPMFVICGGDLAYNENHKKKRSFPLMLPRWMDWLIAWKKQMVTTDGRLIPLIPVIGNHDVKRGFWKMPADASFFYTLFAMPGRQGYNVLDFGDYMSLFLLDSGHAHPIPGKQTKWLRESLKNRKDIPYQFPIYHVAAFPSVRKYKGGTQVAIRKNWVPLFEQFGIKNAFENHDHAYKRTHPIQREKIDPLGIVYIGDGGWAVDEPRRPQTAWYLAKALPSRNVVMVILHDNMRHFVAINEHGQIIDEFIYKQDR